MQCISNCQKMELSATLRMAWLLCNNKKKNYTRYFPRHTNSKAQKARMAQWISPLGHVHCICIICILRRYCTWVKMCKTGVVVVIRLFLAIVKYNKIKTNL